MVIKLTDEQKCEAIKELKKLHKNFIEYVINLKESVKDTPSIFTANGLARYDKAINEMTLYIQKLESDQCSLDDEAYSKLIGYLLLTNGAKLDNKQNDFNDWDWTSIIALMCILGFSSNNYDGEVD